MEWQCPQGLRTSRHLRAATQIPVQPKGPSCTAPVSRARQGFTGLILNTYKSWDRKAWGWGWMHLPKGMGKAFLRCHRQSVAQGTEQAAVESSSLHPTSTSVQGR